MEYLTEKDIIILNTFLIKKYSPKEQIGVKEPTALHMTVESQKQDVFGMELYPTLELKAANLYRNIVMKHIFYNGNKRTAFMALNVFLRKNGKRLVVDQMEAVEFTVKIATDKLEEKEIAKWIARFIEN
ncbi:type II toxin-antitoxin system death-on-curing family toxin [Macrococcus sp. DPC7161]|uniref:type II toxin-antitoxin system death-on-curing family toxin n=1 Tax=Macrococcus sp. DPC7161 TaxID=2507060 RepID=UPI00100AC9D4|nr:type II toxin-antitoxin system death-on-curing family toxin [Macrococcus sp. DPC7161]RXK17511.1 type II toxin-antitoxin system death-on-curing family toxin [Macrococcus sp. DPC7161]